MLLQDPRSPAANILFSAARHLRYFVAIHLRCWPRARGRLVTAAGLNMLACTARWSHGDQTFMAQIRTEVLHHYNVALLCRTGDGSSADYRYASPAPNEDIITRCFIRVRDSSVRVTPSHRTPSALPLVLGTLRSTGLLIEVRSGQVKSVIIAGL